ncbi:MAG: ABC transporter substrate-binding protein [Oscillospiraceae bacterium]|nr:ABC transporter substrate-binding protein [Oscillospiraceae bacterium]
MRKHKRFLSTIVTVLIIALLLGACGNGGGTAPADSTTPAGNDAPAGDTAAPANDGEVFLIGNFQPLSGGNAAFGIEARNAIEMAIEMINAEGGFNGVPVALQIYDVTSPQEAVSVVNRLIEVHNIDALIGSMVSSEILAIGQIANDNQIITFGSGTSPTWMEPDWPFLFRAAMNTDVAMVLTADMVNQMGITRVAVFNGLDDSSIASADAFISEAEALGVTITTRESHAVGDTDFSAQIANILASDPQAVFFGTLGEPTINFVNQLRQLGWNGIVINNESFANFMIDIVGLENSNYIMFTNPYVTYVDAADAQNIPAMYEFLRLYEARWGELPQTEIPYRNWDNIMALWEAAKLAPDNSPESLRQAANQVVFEGLGGRVDFTNGTREGYQFFNRFVIVDGQNLLFDEWLAGGGLEAFFAATGTSF